MTFEQALEQLKLGHRVTREGWNGKRQFIALEIPDVESKMSLPYIYLWTVDCESVPWVASQMDLLADDWLIRVS